MTKNYYATSFFWSSIAKAINAGVSFFSIPLLISHFGNDLYGILSLAMATNAYMLLLDLGINTGAIKYFSQWHANGQFGLIDRVARTSITFYGLIGFVNAFLLIIIAIFGKSWFSLTVTQFRQFQLLLLLLALFSVLNWAASVFSQLLTSIEKIVFIQKVYIIKCLGDLLVVVCTILFNLSLNWYFILLLGCHSLIIIPYLMQCFKYKLISKIKPAFYWNDFSLVLKYSSVIFIMGLFQASASKSRPIILGIFTTNGIDVLTEYRIIEVFTIFIIAIGGSLTGIFLPRSSKIIARKDQVAIEKLAYVGTTYTSIISSILIFPIILCAKELLHVYMGLEYEYLSKWLILWCFSIILFLHNTPISSLVLASGKTTPIAISSAIACVISMIINAILCPKYGVGSAVIGYLIYIIIQQCNYYIYYDKKILALNAFKVLKAFLIPTLIGLFWLFIISYIPINFALDRLDYVLQGGIKGCLWIFVYVSSLVICRVVNVCEIKKIWR